jgi:hypothetical protein
MEILIDITEVAGPKLADLRNIGLLPDTDTVEGRNLHVSNPSGSRIVVRDYETDEVLVSGNGWSNAMQALADHYQMPVKVARDYGVTGGKSGKVLGYWAPRAEAAPATTSLPYAVSAQDVPVNALVNVVDEEWAPVLNTATTEDGRVIITYSNSHTTNKLFRRVGQTIRVMAGADVKLTAAQAALLRQVQAELVHFRPGNLDWAPGYAARADMFELMVGGKTRNRTASGVALDAVGFLAYSRNAYYIVGLTEPAKQWLAAHPA